MRLKGLGQLKNPMTSLGIEPTTFRLVAYCLNGQSGAGAGFLRVFRFPLPIFIPPIATQSHSSIIWGLYNRPEVAAVPSGLSPTPQIKNTASTNYVTACQVKDACIVALARWLATGILLHSN
jgi:hypothetical protein